MKDRRTGQERVYACSGAPIRDGGGKIVMAVLSSMDISERKQAELALAKSKREWERTFDSMPDLVAILDNQHRIVRMNRTMAERLAVSPDSACGKTCFSCVHGSPGPPAACPHQLTLKDGREHSIEVEEPRMGGSFLVTTTPLLDENGRMEGAVHVARDITERKQTEEALRQSLERLKKVLEVETVGVMFWDLNTGVMVDANDTFLKMMGYSRGDVKECELTWQKFTPPEYMDVSRAEVEKFLATGRLGPYETEYFRKDGTRQWLLFAGSSLGNNQCVEFCVDISDRKVAEKELKKLNRVLMAHSRSNQAILHATNEQEFLDEVCKIIVEDCGHRMVWIGIAEHDEKQSVRIVAHAGYEAGYLETLRVTWGKGEYGQGPTGQSLRSGKPAICRGMLTDPAYAPWREEAIKRGYASSIAVPFNLGGRTGVNSRSIPSNATPFQMPKSRCSPSLPPTWSLAFTRCAWAPRMPAPRKR